MCWKGIPGPYYTCLLPSPKCWAFIGSDKSSSPFPFAGWLSFLASPGDFRWPRGPPGTKREECLLTHQSWDWTEAREAPGMPSLRRLSFLRPTLCLYIPESKTSLDHVPQCLSCFTQPQASHPASQKLHALRPRSALKVVHLTLCNFFSKPTILWKPKKGG